MAFSCIGIAGIFYPEAELQVIAPVDIILVVLYLKAKAQFTQGTYNLWCAFHPIIIIALIFAIKGISNDNKLIKDSDRLR